MNRNNPRPSSWLLLAASLALLAAGPLLYGADSSGEKLNFRKFVEGLVSPNRPIRCREEEISIPPNYDWKAQERVETNRQILFDHCEEALPFLIEGCTDARYSLTSRWIDDVYSWSVGQICLEIIAHHVEVFREDMSFSGPRHWHEYEFVPQLGYAIGKDVTDKQKKAIQEWWRGHKGKSIRDLQIEAFDWAIEKRKEERKRLSNGDQDSYQAGDESGASDDIKQLIAARDKLKRSRTYLPPQKMRPSILSPEGYTVVPWTEKER